MKIYRYFTLYRVGLYDTCTKCLRPNKEEECKSVVDFSHKIESEAHVNELVKHLEDLCKKVFKAEYVKILLNSFTLLVEIELETSINEKN